ncbi:hypothetical protein BOX15_Mlig001191g1 [Macrostomum lignano]|uniref:DAGKc domain-containing protein n=1 Tax=Macrostomum lignano TaxID=282301 RepID=A0A267EUN0_9PLAT|nr:hypothetical protein BOX15_Mlig001191g1 [Macrostomum lignano]
MLHLAGFEVQLVEGDAEDENKGFMEVLDLNSTDAVLVAGGDGTLMQAVTVCSAGQTLAELPLACRLPPLRLAGAAIRRRQCRLALAAAQVPPKACRRLAGGLWKPCCRRLPQISIILQQLLSE